MQRVYHKQPFMSLPQTATESEDLRGLLPNPRQIERGKKAGNCLFRRFVTPNTACGFPNLVDNDEELARKYCVAVARA